MLYLYKWKQVAYDCQCGHMRPWAPHLRLPLTKLVREEIHKRQASKQCEMVKKTVKKDPATGSQKNTSVEVSVVQIEIQMCQHPVQCIWPCCQLDQTFRSGGAHMRSSAAYPLQFGRFVAKETYPSYGYPIAVSDWQKTVNKFMMSLCGRYSSHTHTPCLPKAPSGFLPEVDELRIARHHSRTCRPSSRVASEIPDCNCLGSPCIYLYTSLMCFAQRFLFKDTGMR